MVQDRSLTQFFLSHSPILSIASYRFEEYIDGSQVAVCLTSVDTFWPSFFFVGSITIFFLLPLLILIVLYSVIAKHLMENPSLISSQGNRSNVLKYRKQVIFMLGTVVLSFFICLLPFRALTLWIIVSPTEDIMSLGIDGYYGLLYFCRIMLYLNSACNPILYNLMSSKFREGFVKLLGCKSMVRNKLIHGVRKGTFHTTSTNLSSSNQHQQSLNGSSSDHKKSFTRTGSAGAHKSVRHHQNNNHRNSNNNVNDASVSRVEFEEHPVPPIIEIIRPSMSIETAATNIVICATNILFANIVEEEDEAASTKDLEYADAEDETLPDNKHYSGAPPKIATAYHNKSQINYDLLKQNDDSITEVNDDGCIAEDDEYGFCLNIDNLLAAKESLV